MIKRFLRNWLFRNHLLEIERLQKSAIELLTTLHRQIDEIKRRENALKMQELAQSINKQQESHDNTQEIEITTLNPSSEHVPHITKPQDMVGKYVCDMCKDAALHIFILKSGIGDLIIGAKCNACIEHVLNATPFESVDQHLQGKTKVNTHMVGFKSNPYSKWYECGCKERKSHWRIEFNRIKMDSSKKVIDIKE